MLIQVLIIAFAVFATVRTVGRFRAGDLSRMAMLMWLGLWLGIAVAVLNPDVTDMLAGMLGVGRGADAVIYIAIVLLFYFLFRIFVRLERIDHDITVLVRCMSVPDDEPEKSDG